MKERTQTRFTYALLAMIFLGGCSVGAPVSGFEPIMPAQSFDALANQLEIPVVDTTTPLLTWRPFPGTHQAFKGSPKTPFVDVDLENVSDITYQLRIWDAGKGVPEKVVYDRSNLPDTFHKVEEPLAPSRIYFWSMRASFVYDGEKRLTEWSISSLPHYVGRSVITALATLDRTARNIAREGGTLPPRNYFRFRTSGAAVARTQTNEPAPVNSSKGTSAGKRVRPANSPELLAKWREQPSILRKEIAKTHPEIYGGPWHITTFEVLRATVSNQGSELVSLSTRYTISPRRGFGGPPQPLTFRRNVTVNNGSDAVVDVGEPTQVN